MKIHTFRLHPGQDLKLGIIDFANKNNIQAGCIITCVAGLRQAKLRMADATPEKQDVRVFEGPLEVISLVGTVAANGCHLHIAVSDKEGKVYGGHLKEDSLVHLTAEIVMGDDENKVYTRELDHETGFPELIVSERK